MGRKLKAFGVVLGKPFRPGDFFSGLLKHGRDPHEKVHERGREKDLDLDLD